MPVGLLCARIVDCVDEQVVIAHNYCVLIALCKIGICLAKEVGSVCTYVGGIFVSLLVSY